MVADPRNARAHDEQNLAAIAASLARYGQRKPVVVNRRNGQIEAGNGTVLAAAELGWSHVAVVWVEDDAATQHGYAVADNRTAEMAEWNQDILDELLAEYSDEFSHLADALLLDELASEPEDPADEVPAETEIPVSYQVVVECSDEQTQRELYEALDAKGYKLRLITL